LTVRLITDDNWRDVQPEHGIVERVIPYGTDAAAAHGLVTFDDLDVLIPWDDMEERINEANAKKQMPIHHLEAAGALAHNQSRTNYCWAYGLAQCLEALRLTTALPYVRLGPASLGWLVNWRNQGNYLISAIKGAAERGIASAEFVKDGTTDPRTFKEGWKEDALKHKPVEFTDTNRTSERFMAQQCASLLVAGLPLYIAFNWWRHALAGMGVVWDTRYKYNLRWIDWNSHGDGRIEMTGSRGVPSEAYAPRTVTYAA